MYTKRIHIFYGLTGIMLVGAVLWLILALKPAAKTPAVPANVHVKTDAYTRLLHTGDVVLRTGNDATSDMIRNMCKRNTRYSHAGIVVWEGRQPIIYHCIGGENNWNNALRREPFERFVSVKSNLGFAIVRYDMDSLQIKKMLAAVKAFAAKHPSFDLDFDLGTDDKLYCSEMVYKAMIQATGDTAYIPTTRMKDVRYVAIDDLFMNKHAKLVCELRY